MDAYYFDRGREELESEWNAHYDYLSEAYGPTARDAAMFAESECQAEVLEARARGEGLQLEFHFEIRDDDIPF